MSKSLSATNRHLKHSRASSIKSVASSTAVETGKRTSKYVMRSNKSNRSCSKSRK